MDLKHIIDTENLNAQIETLKDELYQIRMKIDADYLHDKNFINREIANAITHGLGAVFFLIAIPVLLAYSAMNASKPFIWTIALYSFGLLMVYLSSTLYHGIQHDKTKKALRVLDHISIFLLIGGSYTPVIYACLPESTAMPFLTILWILIVVGCIGKLFFTGKYRLFSTIFYLAICWMALFEINTLFQSMPGYSFYILVGGGLLYTIGVVFYLWKSINYNHAIWHIFVLGGSVSHYFMMLELARA
jgi:hemolysin III